MTDNTQSVDGRSIAKEHLENIETKSVSMDEKVVTPLITEKLKLLKSEDTRTQDIAVHEATLQYRKSSEHWRKVPSYDHIKLLQDSYHQIVKRQTENMSNEQQCTSKYQAEQYMVERCSPIKELIEVCKWEVSQGYTIIPCSPTKIIDVITNVTAVKLLLNTTDGQKSLNTGEFFSPINQAIRSIESYGEAKAIEVVKLLLKYEELDVNKQDGEFGRTPLMRAVSYGSYEITKILLNNRKTEIDKQDYEGKTAVYLASHFGYSRILKLLIERSAKTNVARNDGKTPLQAAAAEGHTEVLNLLLKTAQVRSSLNSTSFSPLHYAVANNRPDTVRLLLINTTYINKPDGNGRTPLHWAMRKGFDEIFQILIDNKAKTNIVYNDGRTLLHWAAFYGNANVVKTLLKTEDVNFLINKQSNVGWKPIHFAAQEGHVEIMQALLCTERDMLGLNAIDIYGHTPLHIAVQNNQTNAVKLLLDIDETDVNKQDIVEGWTPVQWASTQGFLDILKMLILKGVKVDTPSYTGWTPLHSAASRGLLNIVHILLNTTEGYLCLNSLNNDGSTPLNIAVKNNQAEIVKFLLENNAKADIPDNKGWTPLHRVAQEGNTDIAKLLLNTEEGRLSLGLKVIKSGESPLWIAVLYSKTDIVRLFVNHPDTDVNEANIFENTPLHICFMFHMVLHTNQNLKTYVTISGCF